MLQRKLLLLLGSLVALLLITAFSAILLLNDVFEDLNSISIEANRRTALTAEIGATLTNIEAEFNDLRLERVRHLDHLIETVEGLQRQVGELGTMPVTSREAGVELDRLDDELPIFVRRVGELATTADPELFAAQADGALAASVALRSAITAFNRTLQSQADLQHQRVTTQLRWTVLGLGLVFLVVINAMIIVLLRAADMVLRPIEKLVEASRRLAREEFDHRVEIEQRDEFGELAHAYNALAEQLRLNEQRKVETLHQVARTLSHELNNAIAIIDLQLELMARSSASVPDQRDRLQQIQGTLQRMTRTVEDLKRVRRIVLTDYVDGVKMLDLQRSVEDGPPETKPSPRPLARSTRS